MSFKIDYNWTFGQFSRNLAGVAILPAVLSFVLVSLAELFPSSVSMGKVSSLLSGFQTAELGNFLGVVGFLCIGLSLFSNPQGKWFAICKNLSASAMGLTLSLGGAAMGVGVGLLLVTLLMSHPDTWSVLFLVAILFFVLCVQYYLSKVVFGTQEGSQESLFRKWLGAPLSPRLAQFVALSLTCVFLFVLWRSIKP